MMSHPLLGEYVRFLKQQERRRVIRRRFVVVCLAIAALGAGVVAVI